MVEFVVEIIAHTSRMEMAHNLQSSLGTGNVWVDSGFLGEWKNHLRAWQHASMSDADYAIVLQDDAIPINDFLSHVEKAVEKRPDELISLYVGTHRPWKHETLEAVAQADDVQASWLTARTLLWGVGVVLPTRLIPEMLEGCSKSRLPYDQRLGVWIEKSGRKVYYTWPSLVDHADAPTVAHKGPQPEPRVAHRVGVPNWSDRVVNIKRPGSNYMVSSTKDKKTD